MKRVAILCLCTLILCGCGNTVPEHVISKKIDCAEKNELMNDGAILIDVRTVAEYNEGHLDKSINLTVDTLSTTVENLVKDKNTKIIVYCRSGNRSATAADTLINLGFKNVYDLGAMSNCS